MDYSEVFDKPFIFITGAPRSGTSLVTKIIGAHPDVAMIMENIFGNRRRHWQKAEFWNDKDKLRRRVFEFYEKFEEPILGNKVCAPDVWSFDDIDLFCSLFSSVKIVFVIRDPRAVIISRYKREDLDKVYNISAQENMSLDFSSRTNTYISSWIQSIEIYTKLKSIHGNNVFIVYYDSLVEEGESYMQLICKNLDLEFKDEVRTWYKLPHYNANGLKVDNLKYVDGEIFNKEIISEDLPKDFILKGNFANYFKLFKERLL
jgi:hypothetical protein